MTDDRPEPLAVSADALPDGGFAELFDRFWDSTITSDATGAQVVSIERHLRLSDAARLLLAPSGCGRLAIALAARGHHVLGVERSADAVLRSRGLAAQAGTNVEFRTSEALTLPDDGSYDAAICLRHGLAAAALARSLADGLRPSGRAVIEIERDGEAIGRWTNALVAARLTPIGFLSDLGEQRAEFGARMLLLCRRA